jgi:putative two-component system response regulator
MDLRVKPVPPRFDLHQATLLVVDDVPDNLGVLGELLRGVGYRVKAANCGRIALHYAQQTPPPDLILLDVLMPDMDGYAVLQALREHPATTHIPVIFLSALDEARDEEHGLEQGAVDYITKPIKPAVVLARVRAQLAVKHVHDWQRDQNAALEAEVARRMADNELIQEVSIRTLAHLAETRDPETGNHLVRTQSYVRLLAEQLQTHPRFASTLTKRYIDLVTRSATLHDIGKVGIPDSILLKTGKLTPDEFAIMKNHAALGAQAIERAERGVARPIEFLALAKEIARWHHERWDGSGYPDGLQGEAIPISARLMALADVFDALVSPRIYKQPTTFEQARQIILIGRGQHFDPDVVDAFDALFQTFAQVARDHAEGAARHSGTEPLWQAC